MEEKLQLRKMEELDARVDKINYDLIGLENRKKDLEDEKINKQKEIEKLEKEKSSILEKTDTMKPLQKLIYVVVSLRTDLKRVDLINVKLSEHQKEKNNIQNKIDIQNGLYVDTIKEKDNYIQQRRELYTAKTATREKAQEDVKVSQVKALTQIYEITTGFKNNELMNRLSKLVEKEINQYLSMDNSKMEKAKQTEEQDEME